MTDHQVGASARTDRRETRDPAPRSARGSTLFSLTLPGCWGALLLGCASFTPSLLPRGPIVQGLVWGIGAAIGYGAATIGAWVWRAFADRGPRCPRRGSRRPATPGGCPTRSRAPMSAPSWRNCAPRTPG